MKNRLCSTVIAILVLVSAFLAASQPLFTQSLPQNASELSYHDHPPTGPLPDTLDPQSFRDNRAAFVGYTLAARMKDTLYQVPCYCPCKRNHGHQSLLDCYTSKHGVVCPTCQKELLYCYRRTRKGASAAAIRAELAKGKAWSVSIDKETNRLLRKIQPESR